MARPAPAASAAHRGPWPWPALLPLLLLALLLLRMATIFSSSAFLHAVRHPFTLPAAGPSRGSK
jgi:hypothetical protein